MHDWDNKERCQQYSPAVSVIGTQSRRRRQRLHPTYQLERDLPAAGQRDCHRAALRGGMCAVIKPDVVLLGLEPGLRCDLCVRVAAAGPSDLGRHHLVDS